MRGDKTVTRILLIFSITNVVLAAPAVVQQRRPLTNDESTDGSQAGSPHHDWVAPAAPPAPPALAGSEHGLPVGSDQGSVLWDLASPGGSTVSSFQVSPSGPQSSDSLSSLSEDSTHLGWAPVSGDARLHDKVSSVSEGSQIHDIPTPWWMQRPTSPSQWEVGESQIHDIPTLWWKQSTWRPTNPSQWEVGESSASGALRMQNDPQPAPEAAQLHDDPLPASSSHNFHPITEIEEESPSSQSGTGAKGALEASGELGAEGASRGPLGSAGWAALKAAMAADEEAEKLAQKGKGFCGLGFRCWRFRRSVKWSPERDHGHHFSWR